MNLGMSMESEDGTDGPTAPTNANVAPIITVDNLNAMDSSDFNAAEYQAIMKDKTLMKVFDYLLHEKVEIAKKEIMASATKAMSTGTMGGKINDQEQIQKGVSRQQVPVIKSPSDTTLYAPAVQKVNERNTPDKFDANAKTAMSVDNAMIKKISDFVDSIRVSDKDRAEAGSSQDEVAHHDPTPVQVTTKDYQERDAYQSAKDKTDRAILEAEKYKAVLADPPSKYEGEIRGKCDQEVLQKIRNIGSGLSDDDFFHLTCHVDSATITKIEKGEFVDLDKLLPKDKRKRGEENRMEWIHSDGNTFLAPVSDRTSRITNFRRWEQAFRIYASTYCAANPHRSKEIWQYISVINTASSAYIWDNVYDYDMTFRRLMEFNPTRNWAVTYNQMWNLCMREPLPARSTFIPQKSNSGFNGRVSNTGHKKRKKPQHCWNFNKGQVCKYGAKCRFVERCSYCDSAAHGIVNCPTADKKDKEAAMAMGNGNQAAN